MKTNLIAFICMFMFLFQTITSPFIHEYKEAKQFINELKSESKLTQLQEITFALKLKCSSNGDLNDSPSHFKKILSMTIEQLSTESIKQLKTCRSHIFPSTILKFVEEYQTIFKELKLMS